MRREITFLRPAREPTYLLPRLDVSGAAGPPLVVFSLVIASTLAIVFSGHAYCHVLLWIPLSVVVTMYGARVLDHLRKARRSWLLMKETNAELEAHSLEDVRACLERWRGDYKRGGAQDTVAVAKIVFALCAGPLLFACVFCHAALLSVDQERYQLSALVACVLMDGIIAAILYVAGEITDFMSTQREFFVSTRLRIAEACYDLSEPCPDDDSRDSMAYDLRQIHLCNALTNEILVLESHTSTQSFVVLGFSIDSGRVSHFLALVAAVLQHNFSFQWARLPFTSLESIFILSIFSVNVAYLVKKCYWGSDVIE